MSYECEICKKDGDICEAGKYYIGQIMSFLTTGWGAALVLTGFLLTIDSDVISFSGSEQAIVKAYILFIAIIIANCLWLSILILFYRKARLHNNITTPNAWYIFVPFVFFAAYGIGLTLYFTDGCHLFKCFCSTLSYLCS